MTTNRRTAAIIVLMLLLFILPATGVFAEGNLLQNPGFEDGDAAPAGWAKDEWISGDAFGQISVQSEEVHSGSKAAVIENLEPNHLKWVQNIAVEPDSYYKISGWVKVAGTEGAGTGANVFVVGIAGGYPSALGTDGAWQYLEFYGQTGPDQKEVGIGAALGGYSSLIKGKAYFDDLSVERLDAAPEGKPVISMDSGAAADQGGSSGAAAAPHKVSPAMLLLISSLFTVFFALIYLQAFRSPKLMSQPESAYTKWLYAAFGAALILRVWIGITAQGYQNDMNTFIAWGQRLVDLGPGKFYQEGYFADYPPGYLYILHLLGLIRGVFGFAHGSAGESLLFKLPAILSDLVLGFLIYRAGRKKFGPGLAFGLMLLFLFNPAVLINSAAWGQADSFFLIFLLVSIQSAADKALVRSAIWFALAVLIKPQALIFTPVLLFAFYHHRAWKQLAVGALYGLGAFVVLAAPFFWNNGGLSGLIDLYKSTLSSYPYSSVNAFNLYALTDPLWSSLDLTWLGITYRVWGYIIILAAVALAAFYSFKKERSDLSKSYFIGMILIVVMFVLGTKMHERYLFPVLILCLFSFIQSRDRRFLTLFLGFSLTQYINVGYTLAYLNAGTNPGSDGIVLTTAIANLGLMVYMFYVGYEVYIKKTVKAPLPPYTDTDRSAADLKLLEDIRPFAEGGKGSRLKLQRKDWVWIAAITALYAALALFHLGSTKAPATIWEPAAGESFYVDLGENRQLESVNIFGGAGTGKFQLAFSQTPDNWSSPLEVNEDVGNVFIWKGQPLNAAARYVKLTVTAPGFILHEMAFYAQGGDRTPLPVAAVTPDSGVAPKQGNPANLFDEQSIIPKYSGFMNGTYFDEIYHARTAYEYLHGIVPYENTHPPLGKLLIAAGMELFGVNPFGWRIMGTLFGIAMLPLIYIMALRLFGKSRYAALAAGLFALDFMHFTQTRISTIDVYGVFFIMLMFYFMQRYFTMNFYKVPLHKTLVPLFWSGLFFGIGVASKWIVLYGGAGLAIMLALVLFERYRQYRAAKRVLALGKLSDQELKHASEGAAAGFWKNTILTLLSCLVFFVAIPAAIYSLSFIPVLSVTADGYTVKGLIEAQKNMYDYHSQLVATHPFESSWWQWPFMKRPVWFYSGGEGLPAGQVSSIVTMGNPLIWWTGIFALLGTLWLTVKRKDKTMYMIWIAFLSQYVPWMLVPRETFLYHYFAMVPFMILAIVYVMKLLDNKYPNARYIRYLFVALAALLFIGFYPVLSGMQVSGSYVTGILRWFPTWVF